MRDVESLPAEARPRTIAEALQFASDLLGLLARHHDAGFAPVGIRAERLRFEAGRLVKVVRSETADTGPENREEGIAQDLHAVSDLLASALSGLESIPAALAYHLEGLLDAARQAGSPTAPRSARAMQAEIDRLSIQVGRTRDDASVSPPGAALPSDASLDRIIRLDPPASAFGSAEPHKKRLGLASVESPPRLGRYEVGLRIGEGGMGIVFEARDPLLQRTIALKVLRSSALSSKQLRRFRREAQIAAGLSHPRIIRIHEVGEAADERGNPFHYIAMDRIQGGTLEDLMYIWAISRRVSCLLQVASAVGHAHQKGVIHRDLKPSNILLTPEGLPVVTDFGLAKEILKVEELTQSGVILGTLPYMSPEQIEGKVKRLGPPTDVWALGVLLYEMLTGVRPFSGPSAAALSRQILEKEPVPPRHRSKEVPMDLEAICLKALEKDPACRYPDAFELAEDLGRFQESQSVQAHRLTPSYRIVKWIRRHRVHCVGILSTVLLLVALSGVSAWRHRNDLRKHEGEILRKVSGLQTEIRDRSARLQPAGTPGAKSLRKPNGEVDEEASEDWFYARHELLELLERLASLEPFARTEKTRRRIDRAGLDRRRLDLCRQAWSMASELGRYSLARSWVARASSAGFEPADRKVALVQIDRKRRELIDAALHEVTKILESVRTESPKRPSGWFVHTVHRLVRLGSPEVVRLLLSPAHLDSPREEERRLTIAALGRIGDTKTRGPEGKDTVEALCKRLEQIDPNRELEIAVALAEALSFLRDVRGHDVLFRKRNASIKQRLFWLRTEGLLRWIPSPTDRPTQPKNASEEIWIESARFAYEKGGSPAAIRILDKGIEQLPTSWRLHQARSIQHGQIRDFVSSLADIDRAIELAPPRDRPYSGRANIRLFSSDLGGAERDVELALQLEPLNWQAIAIRGQCKAHRGNLSGARIDLLRACDLQPNSSTFHGWLGEVEMRLGNLEEAESHLNRALQIEPSHSHCFFTRARIRQARGNQSGALRDYTEAIDLDPKNARSYNNRAEIRWKQNDREGALQDWRTALEHDSKIWRFWRNYLQSLRTLDDRREEERKALARALPHAPAGTERKELERRLELLGPTRDR